ncbi:hypothetical protein AZE42_12057 [Rhizopogon vesiculosus]|uniref:Uncharacterized protein n=1 Tax=Rhizopogon vesiculosus TaxID=180088 RepID=A0A1J8Q9R7_9AGAM|nr:hypothetical protein AZE42_12057 [Rhizopogon vesiculosus]
MDNMLPSSNALFNVPQLAEDGSNWITYKERALTALVKPVPFTLNSAGDIVKPAATQPEIEELDEKINIYHQKNSLKLDKASKIWAEICTIHEGKSELVQIDLRRRLQET